MERYNFTLSSIHELGEFLLFLDNQQEGNADILFISANAGLDVEVFSSLRVEEIRRTLHHAGITPAFLDVVVSSGEDSDLHESEQFSGQQLDTPVPGYKNDPLADHKFRCQSLIWDHVTRIDGSSDLIHLFRDMAGKGSRESIMQSFKALTVQCPELAGTLLWTAVSISHFAHQLKWVEHDIEQRAAMN